jgi:integrase
VLRWDDAPGAIVVDFTGRRPMLRIPSEAQKARRDTLLPMTPDFAALLQSVPEGQRRGRVFKLLAVDGSPAIASRRIVGPIVSAIGEAAGVVVDERQKGGKTVRKFASAHDLRRAFGVRWASKVMPNDLRELMRHTDIGTTMKFYAGQNAESTTDRVWATFVDTFVDTSVFGESENSKNRSGDDRNRTCTPFGTGT